MNEGEFSGGQVQPTPNDQGNMPEQSADTANQAIISSADAGATESARPLFSSDNSFDAPQGTISSSGDTDDGGSNPGHLFGNRRRGSSRRIPAAEAQPFVPNPNAPDFFNDAMASMTPTPQPSSNKKGLTIAIIAVVAVLLIGGGILAAVLLSQGGGGTVAGGSQYDNLPEDAKILLGDESYDKAISFEESMLALSEEPLESIWTVLNLGTKETLDENYKNYKSLVSKLTEYDTKKLNKVQKEAFANATKDAQKGQEVFSKIMDDYSLICEAYKEGNEDSRTKLSKTDNAELKSLYDEIEAALTAYNDLKVSYEINGCLLNDSSDKCVEIGKQKSQVEEIPGGPLLFQRYIQSYNNGTKFDDSFFVYDDILKLKVVKEDNGK